MNILYNQRELTFNEKSQLLREAYDFCDSWNAEILGAKENWARKEINLTFEEIMSKFDPMCHFIFAWRETPTYSYYQVGFVTNSDPAYFLTIRVGHEECSWVLEEFGLKGV
jgi:hypothetical protein